MASPVFKTGVTRPSRVGWVRFPHSPAIAAMFFLAMLFLPVTSTAQRADSTRAGVRRAAQADTAASPMKIKPGRAFLGSFLLPGLMQVKLGRPKAATLFLAVEAGTIGMSLKSWNDLKKAKDAREDTVGTPEVDASGKPVIDSVTKQQKVKYVPRDPNLVGRIKARRVHLEDWLAATVFNHLFAGADAFVAAQLQDFKTNVQANENGGVRVMASYAWCRCIKRE